MSPVGLGSIVLYLFGLFQFDFIQALFKPAPKNLPHIVNDTIISYMTRIVYETWVCHVLIERMKEERWSHERPCTNTLYLPNIYTLGQIKGRLMFSHRHKPCQSPVWSGLVGIFSLQSSTDSIPTRSTESSLFLTGSKASGGKAPSVVFSEEPLCHTRCRVSFICV